VNTKLDADEIPKGIVSGSANLISKGFGKFTGLSDKEALTLTQLAATPKGRFKGIEILKRKKLTGAEIRSVLPALLSIQATQ